MITDNKVLALMLINKGGAFANSYQLTKVLEWKFKVMNCLDIYGEIRKSELVTYYIEDNTTYSYELTKAGREVIALNKEGVIQRLRAEFPNELAVLDNL